MKKIVCLFLVVVMALALLSGCADNNDSSAGSGSGASGDEVIIGFPNIPNHFDPIIGFSGSGHFAAPLMYSTLVRTDADMNIVLNLAESYSISEDALTYTFNLRGDAKFTDGTPVTANDVVFTYQTMKSEVSAIDLAFMESIRSDGDSVIITLTQPQSAFILTVAMAGIVPQHAYNEDFGLSPIGSGPFKLVQHDVDQQFILEVNEDYYGPRPAISRFVFVRMSEEDTQLAAVRAGTVDITLTGAVLAAVNEFEDYNLLIVDSLDNMGIVMPTIADTGETNQYGFPVGNNITMDEGFRKAVAYGIDRDLIGSVALNGFATPAFTENDGMPWSNPESKIEFDLSYAVSLLDDLGWAPGTDGIRERNGVRASLPLMYTAGDSVRQAVAMSVAQQARENLGIEFIVESASWDEISARMFSEPLILAWGSSNPMTSFYLFHSSRAGLDDFYNPQNFKSEIVDAYLEQAVNSRTIEEAVPYFQKAQWDGTTGTSMRGYCPYIFLINRTHLYWAREGLDTGRRKIHAHGDAWPLVQNLQEWRWVD
jgi:peptide/nickel transport system substrate-binding protein